MEKDQLQPLLKLVLRSPDAGEGWRNVNDKYWKHVQGLPSDLAEYGDHKIRLTAGGEAVAKYA